MYPHLAVITNKNKSMSELLYQYLYFFKRVIVFRMKNTFANNERISLLQMLSKSGLVKRSQGFIVVSNPYLFWVDRPRRHDSGSKWTATERSSDGGRSNAGALGSTQKCPGQNRPASNPQLPTRKLITRWKQNFNWHTGWRISTWQCVYSYSGPSRRILPSVPGGSSP